MDKPRSFHQKSFYPEAKAPAIHQRKPRISIKYLRDYSLSDFKPNGFYSNFFLIFLKLPVQNPALPKTV